MLDLSTTLLAGAPGKGTTSTAGPGSGFAGTITVRNYVKWAFFFPGSDLTTPPTEPAVMPYKPYDS